MTSGTNCNFTFIIPVKTVNAYVHETVQHLLKLRERDWEAFIVTNCSEPSPWDDDRIKVIASGRVGPGDKRDLAAGLAAGAILVFLDDDSYPREDFLRVLRHEITMGRRIIGGPAVTPADDTFWQQVSGATYLSRLTGGAPERYVPFGAPKEVRDWPTVNLAVDKEAFLSVGGFDCRFWPGEDTFLCDKLRNAGFTIWYQPRLVAYHHRRTSWPAHLSQVGAYGLHRGYFARYHPESSRRLQYFMPSLLLLAIVCLMVLSFFSAEAALFLVIVILCYLVAITFGVLRIASLTNARVALASTLYIVSTHFCYGSYFLKGLLTTQPLVSRLR